PCAEGSHIFFRSAAVSDFTQVFWGLTTTVSASNATGSSMYLTPAAAHACISSLRMGREALEMSVSPRQKRLKPPPVPAMPTVTRNLPFLQILNSSATASAIGNTVLEPSILMTFCACAPCGAASAAKLATKLVRTTDAPNLCHNFIASNLVHAR